MAVPPIHKGVVPLTVPAFEVAFTVSVSVETLAVQGELDIVQANV